MACDENRIPPKDTLVVCRSIKNAELLLLRTADKMQSIGLNIRVSKTERTILILGFRFEIKFTSDKFAENACRGFYGKVMREEEFERAMDQIVLNAYCKQQEKEIHNAMLEKNVIVNIGTDAKEDQEWIWVEGYKGTDKNMRCKEYQYELHKVHEMPEGSDISVCSSGFHFCQKLKHVFDYYRIGRGNRFFRVRALVKKSDTIAVSDKLTSKAIEFLYELEPKEILANSTYADITKDFTDEEKRLVLEDGINTVMANRHVNQLIALGYSVPFAEYIVNCTDRFEVAFAVGHEKEMSMDMKVLAIVTGDSRVNSRGKRNDAFAAMASAASSSIDGLRTMSTVIDEWNDLKKNWNDLKKNHIQRGI